MSAQVMEGAGSSKVTGNTPTTAWLSKVKQADEPASGIS